MSPEIIKRIITSLILVFFLILTFFNNYILLVSLIIISTVSWIEFSLLISKIFKKNYFSTKMLKLLIVSLCFIYLIIFSALIFNEIAQTELYQKIQIFYLFSVCVCSDIGGLLFGRIFKGKKLTKISPNKTVSGSIGSFFLSLVLVPIFFFIFDFKNYYNLIIISLTCSFYCQLGDLVISYFKRKAKIKDTGNILPGHGGLLDRIDGMLLAIPLGILTWDLINYI